MTTNHGAPPWWNPLADHSRCRRCGLVLPCEVTDDGQRVPLGVVAQSATELIATVRGWAA